MKFASKRTIAPRLSASYSGFDFVVVDNE